MKAVLCIPNEINVCCCNIMQSQCHAISISYQQHAGLEISCDCFETFLRHGNRFQALHFKLHIHFIITSVKNERIPRNEMFVNFESNYV